MSAALAERRARFRALHASGCFAIPNPWDVGSARWLQHLGFQALATTSGGAANALGLPDGAVPRDAMLEHVAAIASASDVPVNADFEHGFASAPEDVAENVRRCVETGVSGLSIEDSTRDPAKPLFELALAVERIAAARAAIDATRTGVVLTGRAEGFLHGETRLDAVIERLAAYAAAGAECLFAPGLRTRDQVAEVVRALAPRPVNVIGSPALGSLDDLAALGVRRVSVGSGLARAAWAGFQRAARALADGRFEWLSDATPSPELNAFFRDDAARRR
jgi:2-methylisocitrate lyase-like PEP mutase family enzyme